MGTILVADDDPVTLALLHETITAAGHTAVCASSGQEALALAQYHRPSLILCDVVMPEMDGYELLEALRLDVDMGVAQTPFVFISGYPMREVPHSVSAIAYISKPLNLKAIQGFLQRLP